MEHSSNNIKEGQAELLSETGNDSATRLERKEAQPLGEAAEALMLSMLSRIDESFAKRSNALLKTGGDLERDATIALSKVVESHRYMGSRIQEIGAVQESMVSSMEVLSMDMIRDRVEVPFCKRIAQTYAIARRQRGGADSGRENEVASSLLELLADYGYEVIWAEKGEPFDPREHQALKKLDTGEIALDRTVDETLFAGLRFGSRIVAQAMVSITVHEPSTREG